MGNNNKDNNGKFPYKLVSDKYFENSVAKLQKIRQLFDEFKARHEANKGSNIAPFKPRAKATQKLAKSNTQSNQNTHTSLSEDPKENVNTVNTSIVTEDTDPVKELDKTRAVLKKKNDAIKYLKYHYVKLKKKNISTAFNMLGRLFKRRVFTPGFSAIYEGN
jgi:hypothetical protein